MVTRLLFIIYYLFVCNIMPQCACWTPDGSILEKLLPHFKLLLAVICRQYIYICQLSLPVHCTEYTHRRIVLIRNAALDT